MSPPSSNIHPDVWAEVQQDIAEQEKETGAPDLWTVIEERVNPGKYRPVGIDDAEIADVSSGDGEKRFMLRNPRNDKYIAMGEEELFLWNRMDGQYTVKDLMLAYITEYDTVGQDVLMNFLGLLKSNGFFEGQGPSTTELLTTRVPRRKWLVGLTSAVGFFMHKTFTTKRADRYFAWLYTHLARPVLSRPVLAIALAMVAANLVLFAYYVLVEHVEILVSLEGASSHDIVSLLLISCISVFIHENAHGLAVKHCGRKVLRGGLILYIGLPMAYVDTSDIWMARRGPRVAVSFAGPCANGVLGGLCFVMAVCLPDSSAQRLLLQAGVLNGLLFLANLLPVAETDGHYIIQDYLQMPRLRPNSFRFMRRGVWQKLARRERWTRNDFIHLAYGLMALLGMGFLLYVAVHLWFSTGRDIVKAISARPAFLAEIFGVLVASAVIIAVVYQWRRWRRRARSLARVWQQH